MGYESIAMCIGDDGSHWLPAIINIRRQIYSINGKSSLSDQHIGLTSKSKKVWQAPRSKTPYEVMFS
jgi:hypothetical protein